MDKDTMFYLTATIVCLMLALQITHYWARRSYGQTIGLWVSASWVFVASDLLFTLRGHMPPSWSRVAPTLLVTAAYGLLLLGAQRTAGIKVRSGLVVATILVHGLGLLFVFDKVRFPNGHAIFNRVIWSGFSFVCFFCMKKSNRYFWASINSPAAIFLVQGLWLVIRILMAAFSSLAGLPELVSAFQYLDYIDIILFDGTMLFALLIALLNQRNDEIKTTNAEMQVLSGLLPVCAWCKKVRDDEGYWQEVTDYIAKKSHLRITHGMCQNCAEKMKEEGKETDLP
jgi:hypothetical protein